MGQTKEKENINGFLRKFRGRTNVLGKNGTINTTSLPSLKLPAKPVPHHLTTKKSHHLIATVDHTNKLKEHLKNYSEMQPKANFVHVIRGR